MYIPTALSAREASLLRSYAQGRHVVEAGSLLGYSTIQLARTARSVVAIDRHNGYDHWPNDTLRLLKRNLDVCHLLSRVRILVQDYSALSEFQSDFVFIDLCGTYEITLSAILSAQAPLIAVHDFERQSCKGVKQAIEACKFKVRERQDSIVVLERCK